MLFEEDSSREAASRTDAQRSLVGDLPLLWHRCQILNFRLDLMPDVVLRRAVSQFQPYTKRLIHRQFQTPRQLTNDRFQI